MFTLLILYFLCNFTLQLLLSVARKYSSSKRTFFNHKNKTNKIIIHTKKMNDRFKKLQRH